MQSERSPRPLPLYIFPFFAHEDRAYRDTLHKHLSGLQKAGLIVDWQELEISPGSDWRQAIDKQFDRADIILLFISSDFIASSNFELQMKQVLAKHDAGQARVIPLRIREVFWYDLPLARLEGLPNNENGPVAVRKNADQAYAEIVEGIRKTVAELAADSTLQSPSFAKLAPSLWNVPYLRNNFFTARDELLHTLHETFALDRENTISIQAISGLAGIGKTQIALEYAYRYKHEYQATLWLKGDSTEDLLSSFLTLAPLLNLPEQKEAEQQIIVAAIKRALVQIPKWLMIIDSLELFDLLEEFVPTNGHGHILITTRSQASGTSATLIPVEKLTPDEGALFLLRRARLITPNAALDTIPESLLTDAKSICQSVDGHPLALDQAGAYIEGQKTSLPRYIQLYQKHEMALLKDRKKFATGHPSSVATTFALCFSKVTRRNPAFSEILSLCAFLHPEAIPLAIFSVDTPDLGPTLQNLISDDLEFNNALEVLLDLSLIQRSAEMETINIHRLVQVVLQDEMTAESQRLWAERSIKALSHLFPESEPAVWPQCQRYLPHALRAAEHITRWKLSFPEAAHLLLLTGKYLYDIASYTDALRLCEQALSIAEQTHGDEHPETARTLHYLGNIQESLGHYPQAQSYYERAREIGERVWGAEHPETARILNDLGELFQTLDQPSLAEDYYKRALAIREKSFGLAHLETASSLNNLGGIYDEQGKYEEAEPLYQQALKIREGLRGPYYPDTAESLSNLARFYRIIGKYPQARPLYERSIVAYEHALGPEHPRLATCYNNFAFFCLAVGRYSQAEELLNQALKIRIPLLGPRHLNTLGSWNHLARAYSKQGKYAEAKALYEQILSICEQEFGRKHSLTTSIISNMGELYFMQGDESRAEALLTEALSNIRETQEPGDPTAAPVLDLLGRLYLARAEYTQAELFLKEALEIRQQALGKTHPETALSLKSLGDLALATNGNTQAETLYQQALDILLPLLGPDHPDVAALVNHLLNLFLKDGREKDARLLSEKVRATPAF